MKTRSFRQQFLAAMLCLLILLSAVLTGCGKENAASEKENSETAASQTESTTSGNSKSDAPSSAESKNTTSGEKETSSDAQSEKAESKGTESAASGSESENKQTASETGSAPVTSEGASSSPASSAASQGVSSNPGSSTPASSRPASSATVSSKPTSSAVTPPATPVSLNNRFYIKQLSGNLRTNFDILYAAAAATQGTCSFSASMTAAEAQLLIQILVDDCPELFHIDKNKLSYTTESTSGKVLSASIGYTMTASAYKTALNQCESVAKSIVNAAANRSAVEKEKYVYNYIAANCKYSATAANSGTIYGCLVNKVARCEGISHAMQWLMEKLGVSCFCISGVPTGSGAAHMWNCIQIGGNYYDVDVTSDVQDAPDNDRYYGAFNVSKTWIRSHYKLTSAASAFTLPGAGNMDQSYYAQMGNFVPSGAAFLPKINDELVAIANRSATTFGIQFATQADFTAFISQLNNVDTVVEWFTQAGVPLDCGFYYEYGYIQHYQTILVSFYLD